MHVFISGRDELDKSAIIDRVLTLSGYKKIAGFRNQCLQSTIEHARSEVYIEPVYADPIKDDNHLIGVMWEDDVYTAFPEVFEHGGCRILDSVPNDAEVIVMDELGVFEAAAPVFCASVLRCLDGETPVIGALPRKDTPFLDAVRQHPNVKVIDAVPSNTEQAVKLAVLALGE